MIKKINTLLLLTLLFASLSWAVRVWVAPEYRNGREAGSVMIDNNVMLRFYGDERGVGGSVDRANVFVARLTQLAAMGIEPEDDRFFAGIENDRTLIRFDDHWVCTITEAETTVNMTNDVVLANEWLAKIRQFLGLLPRDSQYVKDDNALPSKGLACRFIPMIRSKDYIVAHRTLPIGSKVRIVNLKNAWSVVAEVAERGVPSQNIVGLAPNTAAALGVSGNDSVMVRVENGN